MPQPLESGVRRLRERSLGVELSGDFTFANTSAKKHTQRIDY